MYHSFQDSIRIHDRIEIRKAERITRTPPPLITYKNKKDDEEDKLDYKKDKKVRDDRKRKKEHRSRSKSRDRKKRKEKKHKKEKEKVIDRRIKPSKEKDLAKEKSTEEEKVTEKAAPLETSKKLRKNPRLVSDRKKSVLDESNFEPDYSASNSDSEDDRTTIVITKRVQPPKIEENVIIDVDAEPAPVKRKRKVIF